MSRSRKKPQDVADERLVVIGKNLQNIRKRRGLTQKELAERIGLTRETVASYETGRTHLMDVTLFDLASVLRVSTDEILGIKHKETETQELSRRWAKRIMVVESLPAPIKKHILRTLDDVIKANTRLTIFESDQ